jgi:hypothetical protein
LKSDNAAALGIDTNALVLSQVVLSLALPVSLVNTHFENTSIGVVSQRPIALLTAFLGDGPDTP